MARAISLHNSPGRWFRAALSISLADRYSRLNRS